MRRLYRPRSFFSLLLTGFVFVALPLIVALVSSIQILDSLAQQSAVAVFRSVNRIEASKKVADVLHGQERAARLFSVLGETEQLEDVDKLHIELTELLHPFVELHTEGQLARLIEQLQTKEQALVAQLHAGANELETSKSEQEAALSGYGEIGELAAQLERLSNALMIREVDLLKERVQRNKKT